jgi:hypothetical protein
MSSVQVMGKNKRKKEFRISERLPDSDIQSAVKVRVWTQRVWITVTIMRDRENDVRAEQ